MELHYYLTHGASFVDSNIAEEATLISLYQRVSSTNDYYPFLLSRKTLVSHSFEDGSEVETVVTRGG